MAGIASAATTRRMTHAIGRLQMNLHLVAAEPVADAAGSHLGQYLDPVQTLRGVTAKQCGQAARSACASYPLIKVRAAGP